MSALVGQDGRVYLGKTENCYLSREGDAPAYYDNSDGSLQLVSDNPTYSAGNIALAMLQNEKATIFGTRERWKTLNRSVIDTEANKGMKIFARSTLGKGYSLSDAYDVSQTQGRELKHFQLQDDTKEMENALATLLNYAVVPVNSDPELDQAAFYDMQEMALYINPNYPDSEAFSAIAAEIAHITLLKSRRLMATSWTIPRTILP